MYTMCVDKPLVFCYNSCKGEILRGFMGYNEEATLIVLKHNKLLQTVLIVEKLLAGESQADIARSLQLSTQWVHTVKKKYIGDQDKCE